MPSQIPPPDDWKTLERTIARFARDYLGDPHAALYGRQGQGQHGLDVLARDRRPAGTGRLWAFQAKNYIAKRLIPAELENVVRLLQSFQNRQDIDTVVVVTTAPVSAKVQDKARQLSRNHQVDLQVWDWEHFSELLLQHCGSGPWLSQQDRTGLRQGYCAQACRELRQAGPLYPLPLRRPGAGDIRLEEVLVQQVLRLASHGGALPAEPQRASGDRSPGSTRPPRHEGTLVEWLTPRSTGKPLILVLAPMGAGKTVALLHAASQLAERAASDEAAPLPLRIRAAELAGAQLDSLIAHMPFDGLARLWADPLCQWIVLVDGLDEVEERIQHAVLQKITALHGRRSVEAVAVTCRTSHLHPLLLPEATQVELPAWREQDWQEFSSLWARHMERQGRGAPAKAAIASSSMHENPLCSTLIALQQPEQTSETAGRARLFRRLTDDLFRRWAEDRDPSAWQRLTEAFEQVALDALAQGGRPLPRSVLEAALAQVVRVAEVEPAIETAELTLGLIRQVHGDAWEFPLRPMAEYLAAGALLRRSDQEFMTTAGKPWAGEVTRLALDRCWDTDPRRALKLLSGLLDPVPTDAGDARLRRTLVAIEAARDRERASAPIASKLASALFVWVTDETSAWQRRRVGAEVRRIALDGGRVWEELWPKLKPVLLASGHRASWLAEHGQGDAEAWAERLYEQDPTVRAVAISRLAHWKEEAEVRDILFWEVQDEGYSMESSAWGRPAFVAAEVLRHAPRSDGDREYLQVLLAHGRWLSSEAAALALLPGEADTHALLTKLKELVSRGEHRPSAYRAIEAHGSIPEGRAWLERHWPEALRPDFAPSRPAVERTAGDSSFAPPSSLVRQELLQIVAEGFLKRDVQEALALMPAWPNDRMHALCLAAEHVPEAALHLLESSGSIAMPAGSQDALGRAALRHPEISRALVARWRNGVDVEDPSSFPGVALEPLAARGEPDAVAVYAAWLPHNPFMAPLIPWCPPSQRALHHPSIRAAAMASARDAWDYATRGRPDSDGKMVKLHPAGLGLRLRGLWPAWENDREIMEDLIAWAHGTDRDRFDASLQAWMEGDFPEEVASELERRICDTAGWPSEEPFFSFDLSRWLSAAVRARMLPKIERMLALLVASTDPNPLIHQATSYLILLHPEEAALLAERAASLRPFLNDDDQGLEPDDAQRLLAAAPEAWGRACLEALRDHDQAVALPFLRMARRLWSHLSDSALRGELVRATRRLTDDDLPWVSTDIRWPCVRLSDAAEELLFFMGESTPSLHDEP
ncbi:restriction endonuclease [Sorangium sp. So ce327]|uniref:NACHT domain-containing protein n=1 Tax=Sorangium sp. So ce327 TaxID=3133301 RepID=UPI003F6095E1